MSLSCADVRDAFLRDELPRGAELEQHLAECAECRELCASDAELGRALSELSRLGQVASSSLELAPPSLERERGARAYLRERPTLVRVTLLLLLALLIAAANFALKGRDLSATPMARLYGVLALYVAGLWLAARAGLLGAAEPGYQRRVRVLALGALALPVSIALLTGSSSAANAGAGAAFACFVYGAALSLPVAFAFFWLDRADRRPSGAFWLSAALSGFAANLVLELHCASQHLGHLLLGHASIGLVALALGLGYGALRDR